MSTQLMKKKNNKWLWELILSESEGRVEGSVAEILRPLHYVQGPQNDEKR